MLGITVARLRSYLRGGLVTPSRNENGQIRLTKRYVAVWKTADRERIGGMAAYEVVDGDYRLTYEPEKKIAVEEWLRPQARFAHLFSPAGAPVRAEIQRRVDTEWDALRERCGSRP